MATAEEEHMLFDLAFRKFETGKTSEYEFDSSRIGSCGCVAGPSGSATRIGNEDMWTDYAKRTQLTGGVVLVQPRVPESSCVKRKRVPAVPAYMLNASSAAHWFWEPMTMSDVSEGSTVSGSMHQVGLRAGHAPSDPTIEQFNPAQGPWYLYIVHGQNLS
jgi:hypothetical protein